jgi:hypothetical protein
MWRTGECRTAGVREFLWIAVLVGSTAGCGQRGPALMPVSGEVKFDGKPLSTGTIEFIPNASTNGPTVGAKIEAGRYTVPREKGAVVGDYRVQITSIQKTGEKIPAGTGAPEGAMVDDVRQVIPREYNSDSTLTAKITKGPNANTNFDLKGQ